MTTGALLWTSPSFSSFPWASTWTVYTSETNDYNNLYLMFPDGTMAALSLATGNLVWHNTAIPSTEYTANAVPYVIGMLMVGGNIYGYAGYSISYQINPIPRFAMMTCINATTGNITYTLNGGVFPEAAADGYIIGLGMYDGNVYCVGKGPTKTTVIASPKISAQGSSVLIEGSVIDMSPSSQDYASQVQFPNGVPAVADENMSELMDYLHMQNSTLLNAPPQCIGVPVTLTAVDPNGNAINIGTATSDGSGSFKSTWTPTTQGTYTVYATFEGSDSYYGSYAETGLSVSVATANPTSTPAIGAQSSTDYTMTIIGTGIAVIIAVAIATVLILRKRP
jgi:hypothetical protein